MYIIKSLGNYGYVTMVQGEYYWTSEWSRAYVFMHKHVAEAVKDSLHTPAFVRLRDVAK
jgi:hypothetical protein